MAVVVIEEVGEDPGILESTVHPLPVEGDDCVGRISHQQDSVAHMPGIAPRGDEGARRVGCPVLVEVRHQVEHIGEMGVEIGPGGGHIGNLCKAIRPVERGKEGTGEGPVWIGQGHQHEVPPGPNVERFGIDGEPAVFPRRHGDFLVAVGEVGLAEVEPVALHHPLTDGAEGPIGAEQPVMVEGAPAFEGEGNGVLGN